MGKEEEAGKVIGRRYRGGEHVPKISQEEEAIFWLIYFIRITSTQTNKCDFK